MQEEAAQIKPDRHNNEEQRKGYEIIFTRIIGHDDIEHGEAWKDATSCWVCEKWSKARVEWKDTDEYIKIDGFRCNIQIP